MTDAPRDVLIRAARGDISHKFADAIPEGEVAYWTVSGTPRQTGAGATIAFAYGGQLIASADIIDVESGRIWFNPLTPTSGTPPRAPPARGFCYVDLGGEQA